MSAFREGPARILVSTDVLARGIDVQQVGAVANFDWPGQPAWETFMHRVGRFGRRGLAVTFVSKRHSKSLTKLCLDHGFEAPNLPALMQMSLSTSRRTDSQDVGQ